MKTCKKLLAILLCAALMLGTVSVGITVYADEQPAVSDGAEEPGDGAAQDDEGQADGKLSEKVEKVELKGFRPYCEIIYKKGIMGYFPEHTRITFTDGNVFEITLSEKETVKLDDVSESFDLGGEEHVVRELYRIGLDNRVRFEIVLDGKTIYSVEPVLVYSALWADLFFGFYFFSTSIDYEVVLNNIVNGNWQLVIDLIKTIIQDFLAYKEYTIKNHYYSVLIALPEMYIKYVINYIKGIA